MTPNIYQIPGCCSGAELCCDHMYCSTPGFLVLHHLPEFAQTLAHWVGHAIQPSHLLSYSFPPTLNFSQHQDFLSSQLFTSGGQSIRTSASAEVLPMNIQGVFPLGWTGLNYLKTKGPLRVFFSTTVWKNQFFKTQPSLWSSSHICAWLLEKPKLWLYGHLLIEWCLWFLVCCLDWS